VGPLASAIALTLLALAPLYAQDAAKIAALEQQAQKYLQEQKPQLAIPVLKEIAALDPNNINARANAGVLLYFQGNNAEAIPHLRAALQLKPDLWRIQALLGLAEKRTGDSRNAQSDLERAFPNLDDKKIQAEAGLELMQLYVASAQLNQALSVASKLEELVPENPAVHFAAYQIARQVMDQSLLSMMMLAPDSAEMHMSMASELGKQGDRAGAIAQFREAIKLNPNLPGAHLQLAEVLRESSDPAHNAQAEGEYRLALRVNPNDELAWRQLGTLQSAKSDFKDAEESFRKAIALAPKDPDARTGLAIVMISTDRASEATGLLESALKEDPTNTVAHFRLSALYRRAGRTAEADREMEAFRHYTAIKDKLEAIYKKFGGQNAAK
jgi:tetratricopeptide (TPR) repeat protein